MNGILSGWKNDGVSTFDMINSRPRREIAENKPHLQKTEIDRYYFDLRHSAEERADAAVKKATSDGVYGKIYKELKELSIKLAFAEIRDKVLAESIAEQYGKLERKGDKRLAELGIDKAEFTPQYSCKICNDTGYDKYGAPCECMKKLLAEN